MLEEVTVAEAAARLGIGAEAVRKRIARGQLQGHKVAGQWRVLLDDGTGQPNQPSGQRDRTAGQANQPPGQPDSVLVAELRERVAYLEAALAREQSNVQVLAMRALPAPRSEPAPGPEPRRRRWRWWPL